MIVLQLFPCIFQCPMLTVLTLIVRRKNLLVQILHKQNDADRAPRKCCYLLLKRS
ncbi:uncharacterized protein METZ01_LOCUS182406 [marine metagenome]|uniref:Uncharacterized protein n=1 Tax=marine metagenome TaxID=408172 RepID=A0A382CUP3_9ZZZZ